MKREDSGFTIVELLLAMSISVIVLTVTASAFMVSLRSTDESTTRLSASQDGGFTSTYFARDVQSSQTVSTTAAACGAAAGQLVVSMSWTDVDTAEHVDYRYVETSGVGQLIRTRCGSVSRSNVVARYLVATPTLTCSPGCGSATSVTLNLDEQDAQFSLTGTRRSR